MIKQSGKILLIFCLVLTALPLVALAEGITSFELQILPAGVPVAQVIIHSIIDDTVPTIAANVTISNESTMDYEYPYEWCVVSSEDNECGGGDDIFSASATKFIKAGEDWNTNLGATVPNPGNYWFKLIVYWDGDSSGSFITFTAREEAPPSPPPPGGGGDGGGGGIITPPATKAVFQGIVYPLAEINILKDGEKIKTFMANNFAKFQTEISNLTAGNYIFIVWARDTKKRKSINLSYSVEIKSGKTAYVSDIFFPPTISLEKNSLKRGEILKISGQSVPKGEISLFVNPGDIIRKTLSQEDGKWKYSFDTSALQEGIYNIKSRAAFEKLISTFSQILLLGVDKPVPITEGICLKADFNKDDKVNLVGFSIFLSWWGKANPEIDLNQNGKVDLPDFSIFLSCWTG